MALTLISTALQAGSHLIPFEDAATLNKGAALKKEQCCTKICFRPQSYNSTETTKKLSSWHFRKQEVLSKLFRGIMSETAIISSI